jgi:thiamine-phosphate pyrophosphorylase
MTGEDTSVANAFARAKLARLAAALNAGAECVGALPPLVLMTDDDRLTDPLAAAQALPHGSLVVLRAREMQRRRKWADALAPIARRRGLVVLVADDPVLADRADGAHFPESKAGAIAYWRARRPSWLITASAHSLAACVRAARFGADAVFLSPVFATASHVGRTALAPIRLRAIARQVPLPIYALGGIDAANAQRLSGAALSGIAAIGALATTGQ